MKRNLFQNVTAIPYKSGEAIDRTGFLSAVIGANVASGATMTVKVEHSDDGETFAPSLTSGCSLRSRPPAGSTPSRTSPSRLRMMRVTCPLVVWSTLMLTLWA